jgi:hypothetical protein
MITRSRGNPARGGRRQPLGAAEVIALRCVEEV